MYSIAYQTCIVVLRSVARSFRGQGKEYKEFIDAESLMPRATSDFRNPVCLEMRTLKGGLLMGNTWHTYAGANINSKTALQNSNNNNNPQDIGSVDSSDTFASCNTHPFHSQGDLTSDVVDPSCVLAPSDSNLYVNPLDKSTDNSPVQPSDLGFGRAGPGTGVKKSASGDTALRSLGASPMDESFRGFGGLERGSRGSLNDSPLPKHRKTRFQQSARPRTRFGEAIDKPKFESQESLETKKSRKTSFMPTRSLASATRIINQHLFGLQTLGGSRTGKNGSSKSSLSVDSIDASPQLEHHRRSKSILKKSDSSGHRNGRVEDPESERLISDNMSGSGVDAGSGSGGEFSPNKRLSATMSPPVRHRTQPQRTIVKTLPLKYQQDVDKSRTLKSPLFLLDDILAGDKRQRDRTVAENRYKESGDCGVSEVPLYICPPPPPMDDHSPTEETRLLLHQTPVPAHKQTAHNSTAKGANQIS